MKKKLKNIFLFACVCAWMGYSISSGAQEKNDFESLELFYHGRLGISATNTANGKKIQYRAHERFPMGCTSKVVGVAAVLKKNTLQKLQKKIFFQKKDLSSWSPVTKNHITDGMTIAQLCEAAITYSDNTAMNVLLKQIGGLDKLNQFARGIGDHLFRQDHGWPQEAEYGGLDNVFDTSTPDAMEKTLSKLTLGHVLKPVKQKMLLTWLINNTTGQNRIRAGVPKGWIVGDKTGTGAYYGTTNDIALIWPPHGKAIVVVIYFTSDDKNAPVQEAVVAKATQVLIQKFAKMEDALPTKPVV